MLTNNRIDSKKIITIETVIENNNRNNNTRSIIYEI